MFQVQLAGSNKTKQIQRTTAVGTLSLAIHMSVLAAIWIAWLLSRNSNLRSPHLTPGIVLELPHLVLQQKTQPSADSSGGNTGKLPPSFGAPPPRALKTLVLPSITPQPKLPLAVSINMDAPNVDSSVIGDPLTSVGILSLGTGGKDSIGSGPGPSIGGGVDHTYQVGAKGVTTPILVLKVEPEYSDEARARKYSGTVTLRIIVDAKGIPRGIKVIEPLGLGLDERAMDAVSKWRFRPGMKDGRPVAVEANVAVSFRLL